MLDLAVVIRSVGERSTMRCIASVDCDAEVIVTLPVGTQLEPALRSAHVRVVHVPRLQMGEATNRGIAARTRGSVVVTDSDCVFEPGTLVALDQMLQHTPVVRCRVVYDHSRSRPLSSVIARSRDFDNNSDKRYWFPGLALSGKTLERLGPDVCHPRLWWVEDADLHDRLIDQGIVEGYFATGVLHHDPLNVGHELRSQLRYGRAGALRALLRDQRPRYFGAHEDPVGRARTILRTHGLRVLLWKLMMNLLRSAAMWFEWRRIRDRPDLLGLDG